MARTDVVFGARDQGLLAMQKAQARGAAEVDAEYKKQARSAREADVAARRWSRSQEAALRNTLAQYVSIRGAIQLINSEYQNWIENERERSRLARSGVEAFRNFALLQPADQRRARIQEVAQLGVERGFFRTDEERAQLADLTQSMQSAAGSFQEGMRLSEAVLRSREVGLETATARELVTQAIVQRQEDPTSFLRMGLVAGQQTARTAEEVSRNAARLLFFDDKAFGFSVAAALTDAFKDESRTFVNATARAFETELDREALGLTADASQRDVLQALADRNITDMEQLAEFGVTNIRGQQALAVLAQNFDEVVRETGAIRGAAGQVGLIRRLGEDLRTADPLFAAALEQAQLESQFQAARAFDVESVQAESRRRRVGLRQLARDRESFLGVDIATETGEVSPTGAVASALADIADITAAAVSALVNPAGVEFQRRTAEATEAMAGSNVAPPAVPGGPEAGGVSN